MILNIDRALKLELLKALKAGQLDTDRIPELKQALQAREPARILTKQEAKELINQLESKH